MTDNFDPELVDKAEAAGRRARKAGGGVEEIVEAAIEAVAPALRAEGARQAQAPPPTPARWLNADGTTSPVLPATAASAGPTEANGEPSQEFLQGIVAAEQDRLRAEGWRACVECIRREYGGMLTGEDTYWVGRKNPYGSGVAGNPAFAEYQRGMVEGARQVLAEVETTVRTPPGVKPSDFTQGCAHALAAAREAVARIEGGA